MSGQRVRGNESAKGARGGIGVGERRWQSCPGMPRLPSLGLGLGCNSHGHGHGHGHVTNGGSIQQQHQQQLLTYLHNILLLTDKRR